MKDWLLACNDHILHLPYYTSRIKREDFSLWDLLTLILCLPLFSLEQKQVLIYHRLLVYLNSLCWHFHINDLLNIQIIKREYCTEWDLQTIILCFTVLSMQQTAVGAQVNLFPYNDLFIQMIL